MEAHAFEWLFFMFCQKNYRRFALGLVGKWHARMMTGCIMKNYWCFALRLAGKWQVRVRTVRAEISKRMIGNK